MNAGQGAPECFGLRVVLVAAPRRRRCDSGGHDLHDHGPHVRIGQGVQNGCAAPPSPFVFHRSVHRGSTAFLVLGHFFRHLFILRRVRSPTLALLRRAGRGCRGRCRTPRILQWTEAPTTTAVATQTSPYERRKMRSRMGPRRELYIADVRRETHTGHVGSWARSIRSETGDLSRGWPRSLLWKPQGTAG